MTREWHERPQQTCFRIDHSGFPHGPCASNPMRGRVTARFQQPAGRALSLFNFATRPCGSPGTHAREGKSVRPDGGSSKVPLS